MADRIAPKGGYLFEEKDKYRREVWQVFAKQTWPPCANVGFMPSTEGAEIPIALDLGFKEENLYAIDRSAALLATAPWRKLYPGVKIYGTDVLRSGARLRNDGVQLDCMNMDLCSNLSQPMLDTFTGFINSGCHDGRIVVALTALCGRESTAVDTLANIILRDVHNSSLSKFPKRIAVAFMEMCRDRMYGLNTLASGEYKSNKQTMSWGIADFISTRHQEDKKREALKYIGYGVDDIHVWLDLEHLLKNLNDYRAWEKCNSIIFSMEDKMRGDIDCIGRQFSVDVGQEFHVLYNDLNSDVYDIMTHKRGRHKADRFLHYSPFTDKELSLLDSEQCKRTGFVMKKELARQKELLNNYKRLCKSR